MSDESTYAAEIWAPENVPDAARGEPLGPKYSPAESERTFVLGTSWDCFEGPLPRRGDLQRAYDRLYEVLAVVHPDVDHPDHQELAHPHVLLGPTELTASTTAQLRARWIAELAD